jgi:hypothetical protein
LGPDSCSLSDTTCTMVLKASISSSTVPPIPALAKLIELVTYTGSCDFRAKSFAKRAVNSNDASEE